MIGGVIETHDRQDLHNGLVVGSPVRREWVSQCSMGAPSTLVQMARAKIWLGKVLPWAWLMPMAV